MADNKFSIDDFQPESTVPPLDDFYTAQETQAKEAPVSNRPSRLNNSITTAMLAGNTPQEQVATYQQINQEYAELGTSPTQTQINQAYAQTERSATLNDQSTYDMLRDPNTPDEIKKLTIATLNDINNPDYSPRVQLATKEATEPMARPNAERDALRTVWATSATRVIAEQKAQQAILNNERLKQDERSSAVGVTAFAEDIVPGASGYKQHRVASSMQETMGQGSRGFWDTLGDIFLPGQSKREMIDRFNSQPYEVRMNQLSTVNDVIAEHGSTILLPEAVDQHNYDAFRQNVMAGEYTLTEQSVDNFFGVLDAIGVGSLIKSGVKAVGGKVVGEGMKQAAEATAGRVRSAWARRATASEVQPAAPSQILKDANPDKARSVHAAVNADETGDLAGGMYGSSKADAIAHDIGVEPKLEGDAVKSKVYNPEREVDNALSPDAATVNKYDIPTAPHFSAKEKTAIRASTLNDFQNATGMVNRKEMTTVGGEGDDLLDISSVYGPSDNGWGSVKAAVDQAQYALRKYDIKPENITILTRQGDEYVPIHPDINARMVNGEMVEGADVAGDFLLRINQKYSYQDAGISKDAFQLFDVSNWGLGAKPLGWKGKSEGSVASAILDPASRFHPEWYKGWVASDMKSDRITKDLLETAKPFTTYATKASKEEVGKLNDILYSANKRGEDININELMGTHGFSPEAVEAVKSFQRTQDALHYMSNQDLVKTLKGRGFKKMVVNGEEGAALFDGLVKPVSRKSIRGTVRAYDPELQTIRSLSAQELDEMYAAGKEVASLENPTAFAIRQAPADDVGGALQALREVMYNDVQYIINPNAASGYLRDLSHHDSVLRRLPGYYAVRYKDPLFIQKKAVDAEGRPMYDLDGNEIWRSHATAGNIADANKAKARYEALDNGEYRVYDSADAAEREWLQSETLLSGGMGNQRARGNRLLDAVGDNDGKWTDAAILSPGEAMMQSIQSLSSRVAYRDVIETSKTRLLATFEDVMPKKNGEVVYPTSASQIKAPVGSGKEALRQEKDAISMWEYINAQENGYINAIDEGWKAGMNFLSRSLGERSLPKGEELFRKAASGSATMSIRSAVWHTTVGWNVAKQFLVQHAQAFINIAASHPAYVTNMMQDYTLFTTRALKDSAMKVDDAFYLQHGFKSASEFEDMYAHMKASGILEGMNNVQLGKNMLMAQADASTAAIRGASNVASKVKAAGGKVSRGAVKAGFGAGEYVVQGTAYMSEWRRALRANGGKPLSKAQWDDVAVKARIVTSNMGRTGELAMNRNSLSIFTQFLQVPTKLIQTFTLRRGLTMSQRLQGFGISAMLGGGGTYAGMGVYNLGMDVYNFLTEDNLPQNETARRIAVNGLIDWSINEGIRAMSGDNSDIEIGKSLSMYDVSGPFDMASALVNDGLMEALAKTPQVTFASRFGSLMGSMGRLFGMADLEGIPPEFRPTVLDNLADIMGGVVKGVAPFSNIAKGNAYLQYHAKVSENGIVSDRPVTTVEGWATRLGFAPRDNAYDIMQYTREDIAEAKKTGATIYENLAPLLRKEGLTSKDTQWHLYLVQAAISQCSKPGKERISCFEGFNDKMKADIKKGDMRVAETILNNLGWTLDTEEAKGRIRALNLPPEEQEKALMILDMAKPQVDARKAAAEQQQ